MKLRYELVELMPPELEEGVVYVSLIYGTVIHKCVCGCGNRVITPLSPAGWKITFDGETISLYPSIGNWSFPCQSHYWIINSTIRHARKWTKKEIANGQRRDQFALKKWVRKRKQINNTIATGIISL